jgi:O-antigen biosynthesis protein
VTVAGIAPSLATSQSTGALQVGDLELSTCPPSLPVENGAVGGRFLLRLHGEACGRLTVRGGGGVLDIQRALHVAILRGHGDSILSSLARRAVSIPSAPNERGSLAGVWNSPSTPSPASSATSLTVAVCTRDRPEGVERVLASLDRTAARDSTDILVIDNAPADERTRRMVERFPWARYEVQLQPGLDHARNMALHHARGTVVAFADDDVVVDPYWCARVRHLFDANPELTLLTGLVEPASLETEAERWFEAYGGFGRGYTPRWIHAAGAASRPIAFEHANTGRYGTGANLAVRRESAIHLGGFDPSLDVGTPTRGGGDLEMMFRVLKGEGMIAYAPDVVVRHAHRLTWDDLASQIESWGSGMVAHLTRTSRAHADERLQVNALRAWLYASWFAKRIAFSYAYAPFPRSLIHRELRGSFRGSSLYAEASRSYPPPAPTPTLYTQPNGGRAEQAEYMLGADDAPMSFPNATTVCLRVRRGERVLGELELQPVGGAIGATRIRDAVADRWRAELLGGDLPTLRRELWACVLAGMLT